MIIPAKKLIEPVHSRHLGFAGAPLANGGAFLFSAPQRPVVFNAFLALSVNSVCGRCTGGPHLLARGKRAGLDTRRSTKPGSFPDNRMTMKLSIAATAL